MITMHRMLAVAGLLGVFGFGGTAAGQSAEPAQAGQICSLKVSGMACGACAARVEKTAKKIDGVTGAKVSQPKGTAEIAYDPDRTTPEAIAKAITERTGFDAHAHASKREN